MAVACPTRAEMETLGMTEEPVNLGAGAFGKVVKIGDYVIKGVDISTAERRAAFRHEASIWEELSKHAELKGFIPEYCWAAEEDRDGIILQRWEPVIPLSHVLETKINYTFGKALFNNLIKGLNHLNSLGYIHRDIKPDNILIRTGLPHTDPKAAIPIFIDFGFICKYPCDTDGVKGTVGYFPPNWLPANNPYATNRVAIEGRRLVPYNSAKHTRKLKRQPLRVKTRPSAVSDRYAMANVLDELIAAIDWGGRLNQKEHALRGAVSFRSTMVGELAAELGKHKANTRRVREPTKSRGATAPRLYTPGALPEP